MAKRLVIKNGRVVRSRGVEKVSIAIEEGRIVEISSQELLGDETVDANGKFVLPGFIETHIHGLNHYGCIHGFDDFVREPGKPRDERPYEGTIEAILASLPKTGVTSTFISSYACPRPLLERFLSSAGKVAENQPIKSAKLIGLDLEGNFLKDPAFAGAQDPNNILTPTIETFKQLQAIAGGWIKKALIAPEWGDSAFELIAYLASQGGLPSIGHSGCTRDQMLKAYDCGTRVVVHTGNGPMSQNFKAGGVLDGIFELGSKLYGEIICDLKHVHPRWINTFINCFTFDSVIGVSDTLNYAGAGLPDGTVIGDLKIENGALWVASKANTLAGSVSTLDIQFNNMVNLLTSDRKAYFQAEVPAPFTLDQALVKLSKMYAGNQSQMLCMERDVGSIELGKKADLLIASFPGETGRYKFQIEKVVLEGAVL